MFKIFATVILRTAVILLANDRDRTLNHQIRKGRSLSADWWRHAFCEHYDVI